MKLHNPNRLSVIFLVPVAMAATNGGCSTTPEPGPLTAEQTVEAVTGNTFQIPNEEMYAFADENGRLQGLNLPRGGRVGQWRIDPEGRLCARWNEVDNGAESCATLQFTEEDRFVWQETNLVILEGNPKDL